MADTLDTLLARWRDERTLALAEQIDALTETELARWTPPKHRTNSAFQEAWVDHVGHEVYTAWCARELTTKLPGDSSDARGAAFQDRLAILRRIRADPRIGHALAQLLILDGDYAFRDALVPVIIRHGDDRTSALLAAAQSKARPFIADGIAKVLKKRPVAAPAPAPRKPAANTERLLAEVYANPDSDDARAVLADALQAAGDPRGEFIALQLAGTADGAKRSDELLKAHAKSWVGELRKIIYRGQFQRGFLARLELDGGWRATEAGWTEIAASPELATVEDLIPGRAKGPFYAKLVTSPAMRALRRFAVWDEPTLEALATTPARVEHLDVRWAPRQKKGSDTIAERILPACARFRSLTSLDLDPEHFTALAASGLLRTLTTLGLGFQLPAALALFDQLPSNIRTVIVGRSRVLAECISTTVAWDGALRIDREGRSLVGRAWGKWMLYEIRDHIGQLPKLARLEVFGAGDAEADLVKAAKRAKLELVLLPARRRTGYVTGVAK